MNKSQIINKMISVIKDYAERYNLEISDNRFKDYIQRLTEMASFYDETWSDNFYRAMGYKKIGYEDFRKHPERYSGIDENLDFQLGEEIPKKIIVKDIIPKQKYPFRVINGVLVNQNALEIEIDVEEER